VSQLQWGGDISRSSTRYVIEAMALFAFMTILVFSKQLICKYLDGLNVPQNVPSATVSA